MVSKSQHRRRAIARKNEDYDGHDTPQDLGHDPTRSTARNTGEEDQYQRADDAFSRRQKKQPTFKELKQSAILTRGEPSEGEMKIVSENRVLLHSSDQPVNVRVHMPLTTPADIESIYYDENELIVYVDGKDYTPFPLPDFFTKHINRAGDVITGLHYANTVVTNRAHNLVRRDQPYNLVSTMLPRAANFKSPLLPQLATRADIKRLAKNYDRSDIKSGVRNVKVDKHRRGLVKVVNHYDPSIRKTKTEGALP